MFEIHIDAKPASEILGHDAPTGFGGLVTGKLRNEAIVAGRLDEFYRTDMEIRLELCRKLDLDIIRSFPYPANPPRPQTDRREYLADRRSAGELVHPQNAALNPMPTWKSTPTFGKTVWKGWNNWLAGWNGGSPAWTAFPSAAWSGPRKTAPDLCVMGWADAAFYHNSWMSVLLEAMVARPELVDRWMEVNLRQILLQLEAQLQPRGADLILVARISAIRTARCSQFSITSDSSSRACGRSARCVISMGFPTYATRTVALVRWKGLCCWSPASTAGTPSSRTPGWIFLSTSRKHTATRSRWPATSTVRLHWSAARPKRFATRCGRKSAAARGPGGGYIIASSNSIHSGIPARNYIIMREAVEEYGHYPIDV